PRRGDGEIDRGGPDLLDRPRPLRVDGPTGVGEELLRLLLRLGERVLAGRLDLRLVLPDQLGGLAPGVGDGGLLLGEQALRLLALAPGALDRLADRLLALVEHGDDRLP